MQTSFLLLPLTVLKMSLPSVNNSLLWNYADCVSWESRFFFWGVGILATKLWVLEVSMSGGDT